MKNLLLILLFVASLLCSKAQTSYYVSLTSGSTANNGQSIGQAWPSIQFAANNAPANSVIYIDSGLYNETINVPTGNLSFKNYQGSTVIVSGIGISTANTALFKIEDQSNIEINGLIFENLYAAGATGIYVNCTPGNIVSNIKLKNLTVRNIGFTSDTTIIPNDSNNAHPIHCVGRGIALSDRMMNIEIDSCRVYNNIVGFSECVTLTGNIDSFRVTNNHIHHNTNTGINLAGNYSYVSSNPTLNHARHGIVSLNKIHHNYWATPFKHGNGIHCDGCQNTLIDANTLDSNWVGISVACEVPNSTADSIEVSNNFIFNHGWVGVFFGGNDTAITSVLNKSITRNNTFYKNDLAGLGNGELYINRVNNCKVINNVFYSNSDLLFFTNNQNPQNFISNYNDYYTPSGNLASAKVNYQWNIWTYNTYKSNTQKDSSSIFADPNLIFTNTPDALISNTSPCINKGDSMTILHNNEKDYFGNARVLNNRIDIGACEVLKQPGNLYEYGSSNQIAAYPNPSCGEFTIQLFNKEKVDKFFIFDCWGRELQFTITQNHPFYMVNLLTSQAIQHCMIKVQTENRIYTTHVVISK